MDTKYKLTIGFLLLGCFLAVFFRFQFVYDNKYTTPPPYGQDGVLSLQEENLSRNVPIYLIDGWLLLNQNGKEEVTFIGEFSNLMQGDNQKNPHGEAVYQLTLRYGGNPIVVSIDFPELFTDYRIFQDGTLLSKGKGTARVTLQLLPGDTVLTVKTVSHTGYYSGMYFPPALSTPQCITDVANIRTVIYAIGFWCPLILTAFTMLLWRQKRKDPIAFLLALFNAFFVLYMSYYFVHLLKLPFASYWYYVEELALYAMIFCLIRLTNGLSGLKQEKYGKLATLISVVFPCTLLLLHGAISYWSFAIVLHGFLKNLYIVLTFFLLLVATVVCIIRKRYEYGYVVFGNSIFGVGLLLNLVGANLFEPIYSLWQFEWCGLLLVWLFASMMIARNRRIIKENEKFTFHLEGLVEKRTEQLVGVLHERQEFFSDMAHDLKAPLMATKTFMEAIRTNHLDQDEGLNYYLQQIENKQQEMTQRVQSLKLLNALDQIAEPRQWLSIHRFLKEVDAIHRAEAEVGAIHLIIKSPDTDCFVFIQPEKLFMVFENLIYNALLATPPGGSMTIAARQGEELVQITVDDTGCGIPETELPLIFKRFYVGSNNTEVGSGLGLYIVKKIIDEAGGEIRVTSQVGKGTRFVLEIPSAAQPHGRRRED